MANRIIPQKTVTEPTDDSTIGVKLHVEIIADPDQPTGRRAEISLEYRSPEGELHQQRWYKMQNSPNPLPGGVSTPLKAIIDALIAAAKVGWGF